MGKDEERGKWPWSCGVMVEDVDGGDKKESRKVRRKIIRERNTRPEINGREQRPRKIVKDRMMSTGTRSSR